MAVQMYKKLQVSKLTSNFREAVTITEVPLPSVGLKEVLVKNVYSGVNATDINATAGRYFSDGKLPFDIGFEALGLIEKVGEGSSLEPGNAVLCITDRAYSEYMVVPEDQVVPLPQLNPKYIVGGIVGLTASIGLDEAGQLKSEDKVLVTAAAGGTGHICVQWAKLKGCHVIGTCSSKAKEELLKSIGCDRIINYKEEDIDQVLRKEYPNGVDVIWETIGGSTAAMLYNHLARKGRLVIIGGITGYKEVGFPEVNIPNLFGKLVMKSQHLKGFLLLDYPHKFSQYGSTLISKIASGEIKAVFDDGSHNSGPFVGLSQVADAVEYLHSGKSIGKVVVKVGG